MRASDFLFSDLDQTIHLLSGKKIHRFLDVGKFYQSKSKLPAVIGMEDDFNYFFAKIKAGRRFNGFFPKMDSFQLLREGNFRIFEISSGKSPEKVIAVSPSNSTASIKRDGVYISCINPHDSIVFVFRSTEENLEFEGLMATNKYFPDNAVIGFKMVRAGGHNVGFINTSGNCPVFDFLSFENGILKGMKSLPLKES